MRSQTALILAGLAAGLTDEEIADTIEGDTDEALMEAIAKARTKFDKAATLGRPVLRL